MGQKLAAVGLLGTLMLAGCTEHATDAERAADKAAAVQAAAARQQQVDEQIAARKGIQAAEGQLAQLPPPAKGRYLQVRSADSWNNPFLIVSRKTIMLRALQPPGAGRRELTLRITDLPEALAALPGQCWEYGRVVAVEEDPATPRRERPQMRRNVEAVMGMLNDLDVVADEWPYGQR